MKFTALIITATLLVALVAAGMMQLSLIGSLTCDADASPKASRWLHEYLLCRKHSCNYARTETYVLKRMVLS